MTSGYKLKVFDIQGFSVHDGPGIRQTIFLQGCPLRCQWCHSLESQAFDTKILWLSLKCVGCKKCVKVCPTGARAAKLSQNHDESLKILCDWDKCTNCGACINVCLTGALYYCGVDYSVDELIKRIKREKSFYDKSGGGVTTSGGECLCQADAVADLYKKCHDIGVKTACDTSGFVPWESIEKVLPHTDLFLYDIKHLNSEQHKLATAVPNEQILENARKIAAAGGKLHIRAILIPGFNDGENLLATRDFLLEIKKAVVLIQILPYHSFGEAKYERLSLDPPDLPYIAPTQAQIDAAAKVFEDVGFEVTVY